MIRASLRKTFFILIVFSIPMAGPLPDSAAAKRPVDGAWEKLRDESITLLNQGKLNEGHHAAKKALDEVIEQYGPNHPETSVALKNLSGTYMMLGDLDKAYELITEAYRITESTIGTSHVYHGINAGRLADTLRAMQEYQKSEVYFKEAVEVLSNQTEEYDGIKAVTLNNYAMTKFSQGDYDRGIELLKQSISIQERLIGKNHPDVVRMRDNLLRAQQEKRAAFR